MIWTKAAINDFWDNEGLIEVSLDKTEFYALIFFIPLCLWVTSVRMECVMKEKWRKKDTVEGGNKDKKE